MPPIESLSLTSMLTSFCKRMEILVRSSLSCTDSLPVIVDLLVHFTIFYKSSMSFPDTWLCSARSSDRGRFYWGYRVPLTAKAFFAMYSHRYSCMTGPAERRMLQREIDNWLSSKSRRGL